MEPLIDFIKDNPLYAAGAAVLLLFFVISLIKKGVTLAIIALALNGGYGYYLSDMVKEYYQQAQDKVEVAKDKLGEAQEKYESVKSTVDKAGATVDKASETVDKASDLFEKASKAMDN